MSSSWRKPPRAPAPGHRNPTITDRAVTAISAAAALRRPAAPAGQDPVEHRVRNLPGEIGITRLRPDLGERLTPYLSQWTQDPDMGADYVMDMLIDSVFG
ncbi:hypothetical protein GOHSU_31_00160 [Gordonia hirsuta DSM 44140 = NBRC 16056]|uniref:Uncharacterized protein n=1 Tax=Gordonia hirsuta DSM 44140 = NBRC 16056 TaxID=1121927 RepID=L7LAI9_9ACTN|nr:hypothetical protein GOHSU_31_00160 [Gordonia hirsuta DSM 44140 = NBRC 16056]